MSWGGDHNFPVWDDCDLEMCYCLYWARESLQLQQLTTPSPQLDSWQSVTSWDTSLETKILCVFMVWRNSSVCYSNDWKEFSELKSEAAGGFYATFSCNFFMCFQANLSCKNQCWSHKIVLLVTHLSLHWSHHWLRLMQRSLRMMLNSFHPEAWWSVNWELFSEVSQHCNHQ